MRKRSVLLPIALIGVFLLGSGAKEPAYEGSTQSAALKAISSPGESTFSKVDISFGRIPLYFIPNEGQVDGHVAFYVQGRDKTIYFTPGGLTFVLSGAQESEPVYSDDIRGREKPGAKKARISGIKNSASSALSDEGDRLHAPRPGLGEPVARGSSERWVVKLDFVGTNPEARPVGVEETGALISYFKGKPEEWKTGLPACSKILYEDLWPGVDLLYHGTYDRMKYEFIVHPGADPSQIRLAYRGAERVRLTDEGRLVVETPLGSFEDEVPEAWQENEGAQMKVDVAYVLEAVADNRAPDHSSVSGEAMADEEPTQGSRTHVYGFEVGEYDRDLPLVLDPAVLLYCGYIGGSGGDYGQGIAVDGSGNAYITGYTSSTQATFPVHSGPYIPYNGGSLDAFVAKVNPAGTTLLYCGYIGGSSREYGNGIAVDGSGNAYVTGTTLSTQATFPVRSGPDLTHDGLYDAFVAKVNAAGTKLLYCGYIGGSNYDYGNGIAVDGSGNAYVTGHTYSDQGLLVLVGPYLTHSGSTDAFVAKVNPSGTAFLYCGYIGGEGDDSAYGIAVDGSGNAYVTGDTYSTQDTFPLFYGPDLTHNDYADAFVAKVSPSGAKLLYCGYIGGSSNDYGRGIAVDDSGNAYVTGDTYSTQATFPVLYGPDLGHNGNTDAFVAKVNPAGTTLLYCGYIGGGGHDYGKGIAVDGSGNAYVIGDADSLQATFPVLYGPDLTYNGYADAFVAKVNPSGTTLLYCGYIGGQAIDDGRGIAVDASGNAYVTGFAGSAQTTFPVLSGPDLSYNGSTDAFVARISPETFMCLIFDGHDFNGNGTSDVSVFRPSNGRWYIKGVGNYVWGAARDIPVNGDYNGDGKTEIAVWRPSNGRWYIKGVGGSVWGTTGDIPVPADYNGDGKTDVAVWRPSNGRWYIKGVAASFWGTNGDVPAPGDYDGNGITDLAIWRPSNGGWYIKGIGNYFWGMIGDIPLVR